MATAAKTPAAPKAAAPTKEATNLVRRDVLFQVPLSQIEVLEGFNQREDYGDMAELTASIISEGVRIPGVAYLNAKTGKYVIIEGHRRRLGIELAAEQGKTGILMPLVLEPKGTSEADRMMLQLTTGTGSKPLTMLEQAKVIKSLVNFGLGTADIAKRRGVSPAAIDNLLILTQTSSQTQEHIKAGTLSPSLVVDTVRSTGGDVKEAEKAILPIADTAKQENRSVKRNEVAVVNKKISLGLFEKLVDNLETHFAANAEAMGATARLILDNHKQALQKAYAYFNGELRFIDWFGVQEGEDPTVTKKATKAPAAPKAKATPKAKAKPAAKGKAKGKETPPAVTEKIPQKPVTPKKDAVKKAPAEVGTTPPPAKAKGKAKPEPVLASTEGPTAPQEDGKVIPMTPEAAPAVADIPAE